MTRGLQPSIPRSTAEFLRRLSPQELAKPSGLQGKLEVAEIGKAGDALLREYLQEIVTPGLRVCDMGCARGQRAIISAARGASVDAAEIHGPTLETARQQISQAQQELGQTLNIQLIQSDLFENLAGKKYDLITFFPPLVNEKRPASLADPDFLRIIEDPGFSLVREFLRQAREHLSPQGKVVLGYGLHDETEEGDSHVYRGGQETLQMIAHELGWQVKLVKQQREENFAVYELRPSS